MTVVTNSRYDASSASVVGAGSRLVATSTNPAAASRAAVISGVENSHTPVQSAKYGANGSRVHHVFGQAMRVGEIRAAAALREQAPAAAQAREDLAKERLVIADPVERRRAEDEIGPGVERHRGSSTCAKRHAIAEVGPQVGARRQQHVPRSIDRDQPAVRQHRHQLAGQPPGAAAGVDDALVAAHRQSRQHAPSPLGLRRGDAVVGRRVPLSMVRQVAAQVSQLRPWTLAGSTVDSRAVV